MCFSYWVFTCTIDVVISIFWTSFDPRQCPSNGLFLTHKFGSNEYILFHVLHFFHACKNVYFGSRSFYNTSYFHVLYSRCISRSHLGVPWITSYPMKRSLSCQDCWNLVATQHLNVYQHWWEKFYIGIVQVKIVNVRFGCGNMPGTKLSKLHLQAVLVLHHRHDSSAHCTWVSSTLQLL